MFKVIFLCSTNFYFKMIFLGSLELKKASSIHFLRNKKIFNRQKPANTHKRENLLNVSLHKSVFTNTHCLQVFLNIELYALLHVKYHN
jgi:hypothetical protein